MKFDIKFRRTKYPNLVWFHYKWKCDVCQKVIDRSYYWVSEIPNIDEVDVCHSCVNRVAAEMEQFSEPDVGLNQFLKETYYDHYIPEIVDDTEEEVKQYISDHPDIFNADYFRKNPCCYEIGTY